MNGSRPGIRAGLVGGLVGGAAIWVYEAVVWAGIQHLMPITAIPANAAGLTFGKAAQAALGLWASLLGTLMHFGFACVWGAFFAAIWPWFQKRGWEATTLALPFAAVLWVVMHGAIALAGHEHPNYLDPAVVIGGVMSHLFFAVPLALTVRALMDMNSRLRKRMDRRANGIMFRWKWRIGRSGIFRT